MIFTVDRGHEKPSIEFEGGSWTGDERLLAWIEDASGEVVTITPTGPDVAVSAADPRSVLRLFERDLGPVTITGEMPPWPYLDDGNAVAVY